MQRMNLRDQMEVKLTELLTEMEKTAQPSSTPRIYSDLIQKWMVDLKDVRYYIVTTETPEK